MGEAVTATRGLGEVEIEGGPRGREGCGRSWGRDVGNEEVVERMGEATMGARAPG